MAKEAGERKLTDAEKARLAAFEQRAQEYVANGFTRHDLVIDARKANVQSFLILLPVAVLFIVLYMLGDPQSFSEISTFDYVVMLVLMIVLIVVHELLHGLGFGLFAPSKFRSISFGFMREAMAPYCTCSEALPKGGYLFGALLPLVAVGLVPAVWGVVSGSFALLFLGVVMIFGAGGDVLISAKLLSFKPNASEVLYADHPSECGLVAFVRE